MNNLIYMMDEPNEIPDHQSSSITKAKTTGMKAEGRLLALLRAHSMYNGTYFPGLHFCNGQLDIWPFKVTNRFLMGIAVICF